MASKKLGTKRHCQSCDGKFYDLNKAEIVCPMCGTVFDPEVLLKSRRSKPMPQAGVKKASEAENTDSDDLDDDIDAVDDDSDSDDDILEDDTDLIVVKGDGDDDDAISTGDDDDLVDVEDDDGEDDK